MNFSRPITRLLDLCGIDPAVGYVLAANAWNLLIRPLQVVVIVACYTAEEQGVYFTFFSILALQIFFELGFGTVVQQIASHEYGFLRWNEQGLLDGVSRAKGRVASLVRKTLTWYSAVALLMVLTVGPAGWWFFQHSLRSATVQWHTAWVLIVTFTGLSLLTTLLLQILSGLGQMAAVARINAIQTLLSSITFCLVVAAGGGLLAVPVSAAVGFAAPLLWLWRVHGRSLRDLWCVSRTAEGLDWLREVLPFQWRIAVSWLSGFFVFQLINPVALAAYGPRVAGQVGLSLALTTGVQLLAFAWIQTKAPTFGTLIAQRRFADLDRLFRGAVLRSCVALLLGTSCLTLATYLLPRFSTSLAERVVSWELIGVLSIAAIVNNFLGAVGVYLRAHKREPLLLPSVVTALITAALVGAAGWYADVQTMLVGMLALTVVISLPWGTAIFLSKRRTWHQQQTI